MNDTAKTLGGPDLAMGIALSKLADGAMLVGHAHGERVHRDLDGLRGEVEFERATRDEAS